jgi:cell division protein FtsL
MRIFPFFYAVILTFVLFTVYISHHNRLTQERILAVCLERQIKAIEAQVDALQLEYSQFLSPIRLEEIAKKAQYAHLKSVCRNDIRNIEDL